MAMTKSKPLESSPQGSPGANTIANLSVVGDNHKLIAIVNSQ